MDPGSTSLNDFLSDECFFSSSIALQLYVFVSKKPLLLSFLVPVVLNASVDLIMMLL